MKYAKEAVKDVKRMLRRNEGSNCRKIMSVRRYNGVIGYGILEERRIGSLLKGYSKESM